MHEDPKDDWHDNLPLEKKGITNWIRLEELQFENLEGGNIES